MRGRVLLCACVVLLLLPLAAAQSGSGGGGGSNPDDDQFKTDLTTFFTKLGNIQPIDTTGGTTTPPTTAPAGKDKGHSHLHSKSDAAISNIPGLTSDDIKHMKNSLQQAPDWQTFPDTLADITGRQQQALDRIRRARQARLMLTSMHLENVAAHIPDDCSLAASTGITRSDLFVAQVVGLTLRAIWEAVPDDTLSAAAHAIAGVAVGIADEVTNGLQFSYDVNNQCQGNQFSSTVLSDFDTLSQSVTNVSNQVKGVSDGVTQLLGLVDVKVSTRASQASLDADTAAILASIKAARDEALRIQIEDNLAGPDGTDVGLFELPNSLGGDLEIVRTIVVTTIGNFAKTGKSTTTANNFLAQADSYIAQGNYKAGFQNLKKAYKNVIQ